MSEQALREALVAARDVLEDLRPMPFDESDPALVALLDRIDAVLATPNKEA